MKFKGAKDPQSAEPKDEPVLPDSFTRGQLNISCGRNMTNANEKLQPTSIMSLIFRSRRKVSP